MEQFTEVAPRALFFLRSIFPVSLSTNTASMA
jgi:hypothetical protein